MVRPHGDLQAERGRAQRRAAGCLPREGVGSAPRLLGAECLWGIPGSARSGVSTQGQVKGARPLPGQL